MTNYINILREWNFWDNKKIEAGIKRKKYLDKLIKTVNMPEITSMYGIRRSGKSTLLLQFINELHIANKVPYQNTLYINFEDPRLSLEPQGLFQILEEYENTIKPKGKIYLFLDEIQKVEQWEQFARTIYDQKRNIKLYVTGSTSETLSSDLTRLLSGRVISFKVTILDFSEFLSFKKEKKSSAKISKLLDEYLQFGGFPRIILEKNQLNKTALLASYYETIIEKDVILKNNIKNKLELKQLVRFVLSNIANQISSYSLEKTLKISNENINRYLGFLEEAFIISRIPLFSFSVKKQIYNPDKIYCVDTGLANMAGFKFSENKGKLLENLVFNKLSNQNKQIYYWKNNTEIDLVIFNQAKIQELINITLTVDDPVVLQREITSLMTGTTEFTTAKSKLYTLYNESEQKHEWIYSLMDFLTS